MSLTEIKKSLANYGLSKNEVKVYLALLSLGEATVRELSLESEIRRTTIYLTTEKLIQKGIIGQYKSKYGTHFVPSPINSLTSRLDNIRGDIEKILPMLKAIEKKELTSPVVKYYQGKQGYHTILDDSLAKPSSEVLYLGSAQDLNEIIGETYVLEKYIPERLKNRIYFRELVFPDEFSKALKAKDNQELRKTKFLPEDYQFSGNMIIYQDKIAYFSSKLELISVLIQSPDIAEMEKKKFELLWKSL